MKKYFIIFIIIIAVFILFYQKDYNPSVIYKTEKLKKGVIQEQVSATGTMMPVSNILIGATVSGIIKQIYVDFNDIVKKGQILALIDPEPFIAQVEQAKANLLMAEANLEKAKVVLLEAENNYKRYKKLYEENLISESEYERYLVHYQSAIAQVKEANARIVQLKAVLKQAQTNLKYTQIRSPVNGIVISRNVEIGQTVAASFQTPTLFQIAENLSKMQIHTNVDEADIGKIQVGQKAFYTVDAYPDKVYEGKVIQIRNAPNVVQNVVTYNVIITVNNQEMQFKPGMTAQVTVLTARKENIFIVKNSALRVNPNIKTEQKFYNKSGIWVLKNNEPLRIEIETGISDNDYIEVISKELQENMDVIVDVIIKDSKKRSLMF